MGRPLNKKYFGNRNIGTGGNEVGGNNSNNQNYADDRIGGEGVDSYTNIQAGTGWTTAPTVTFGTPDIPGGVQVEGTVHYKALSFATTANGSGYSVGDVLEVVTGTAATEARAPVASIVTVGVPTVANGGTLYDVELGVGDRVTFTNAGLSQALVVEITAVNGGGVATTVEVVTPGVWNGAGAPTTTTGWTAVTSGGPTDNNGSGLVLNLAWGVFAFGAVTVAGDYTAFPATGTDGLLSNTTGSGTGAKADITLGLLSVDVTEKGSGYTSIADAQVIFGGATGAAATAVLTVDTGVVGSSTNQENAIVIRANTSGGGTTAKVGDIIRQVSTRRYKVKTADGIKVCKLGTDDTPAPFGAYIVATATGGTYYVTKLTAHKATLATKTGDGVLNGQAVRWTFGAPGATVVQIENA